MYDPEDGDPGEWQPGRIAISVERFGDPPGDRPPTILVTHVAAPYVEFRDERPQQVELEAFAHAYLSALDKLLADTAGEGEPEGIGLPDRWLDLLAPESVARSPFFGWAPIGDASGQVPPPPGSSLRLQRFEIPDEGEPQPLDGETVILSARDSVPDGERRHPINSAFGISVTIHLVGTDGARWRLMATGLTAHLPHLPYVMLFETSKEVVGASSELLPMVGSLDALRKFSREVTEDLLRVADLDLKAGASVDEIRIVLAAPQRHEMEFVGRGLGRRVPASLPLSYRFTSRRDLDGRMRLVSRQPLVAAVSARLFEQDPASWRAAPPPDPLPTWITRRPTREELDRFRRDGTVPAKLATPDFEVLNCPAYVPGDGPAQTAKTIPPNAPVPPVRDNDQAGIAAYWSCRKFFRTMRGFGILPQRYFRHAVLPVEIHYRSGIRPGPGKDGQTINAQVLLRKLKGPGFLHDRISVEMHLALANLSRRARKAGMGARAIPLGIANDERFIMHEFGHVLIAARFRDQLEFLFAHSPGDALAAIWSDPRSWFAAPGSPSEARGWTFPWVFTTRRHDRRASDGWSWSGTFQHGVNQSPAKHLERHKGYLSEQILSSSLFRLYRIVGGDTVLPNGLPDIARRLAASRLVIYLILRGIESFAKSPVRAEEFATALINADVGLLSALPLGPQRSWTGGTGHKPVRWAFEAQGMYPPPGSGVHNAPGEAPEVDIYIPNRRPPSEAGDGGSTQFGPGGYPPVSLDWSNALWMGARRQDGSPDWRVGNRGRAPAPSTHLRAWLGELRVDPATEQGQLDPNGVQWLISGPSLPVGTVQAGAPQPVANTGILQGELTPGRILLLEASSPGDRANTDPATQWRTRIPQGGWPPTQLFALTNLVANDNNLALWRF